MTVQPDPVRRDILELAAGYAEESVIVTTADLDEPGPRILYVNSAFTSMTGYSAGELMGRTPRLLQGPDTDRERLDDLKAELQAGNDFIARTTNYRRDGTPFELEWIISHLRNEAGETTHYVAVQRDITGIERATEALHEIDAELVELSRQLQSTLDELHRAEQQMRRAERMNALGRMARGVSHDLANSLMPMDWLLDRIDTDPGMSEQSRADLAALRANVGHALSLHRHLAEFARTTDHSERITVTAAELTEGILDLTRAHQTPTGSPVEVTLITDDDVELTVNPVELRQVILNLAVNAMESMTDGGTIDLRVSAADDIVIEVSDTGPGMEPDVLQHCFEPFYTTRDDGTGLGLSICHSVVEAHGGSIEVDSAPGEGTTFRIHLPRTGETPRAR